MRLILLREIVKRAIAPNLLDRYRRLRYWQSVIREASESGTRECPVCGYIGDFVPDGHPPRYSARCPSCGTLERHRLFWLACVRLSLLPESARILHFAPEAVLSKVIGQAHLNYMTADVIPGRASMTLNIEEISLPNDSVDVVIANHVLEHVNDRRALLEIKRIVVPGGRLVTSVPLVEGWTTTYEDPAIRDPAGRTLHFGQHDHVRYYGRDFRDLLRSAGLVVAEFACDGAETVKFGLRPGERIFIATKPS